MASVSNPVRSIMAQLPPPLRRPPPLDSQIAVVARQQDGGRCPYCHDEVEPADREDCARCATPHHVECYAIHRGCAAFSCQGLHKGSRAHVRP